MIMVQFLETLRVQDEVSASGACGSGKEGKTNDKTTRKFVGLASGVFEERKSIECEASDDLFSKLEELCKMCENCAKRSSVSQTAVD